MEKEEKIVLVYTGDLVTIEHINNELEAKGINTVVKDGYQEGLDAGFIGGTPSSINIFVLESDVKDALEIIKAIIE